MVTSHTLNIICLFFISIILSSKTSSRRLVETPGNWEILNAADRSGKHLGKHRDMDDASPDFCIQAAQRTGLSGAVVGPFEMML